jgi:hypothetical protein
MSSFLKFTESLNTIAYLHNISQYDLRLLYKEIINLDPSELESFKEKIQQKLNEFDKDFKQLPPSMSIDDFFERMKDDMLKMKEHLPK